MECTVVASVSLLEPIAFFLDSEFGNNAYIYALYSIAFSFMYFVDVIVPLQLPQLLTYSIPIALQGQIAPGQRVEVNLGKNKRYAAIVFALHNRQPDGYQIKPIQSILDETPIVNSTMLQFWEWLANYYVCSLGEIMNAALPAHLKLMSEHLLIWSDAYESLPEHLSDDAYILAEALSVKKRLTINEARMLLPEATHKAITEVLDAGIGIVMEHLDEKYQVKTEKIVSLNVSINDEAAIKEYFEHLKRSPQQQKLLIAYFQIAQQEHTVTSKRLLEVSGCNASQLQGLVNKQIVSILTQQVDRLPSWGDDTRREIILSAEQQTALTAIYSEWAQHQQVLLQGVTGSGKTLLYIEIIRRIIAQDKRQALFLLPEIALSTQMIVRLKSYFGEELGVYHSKFSNNERVEIWNKVQNGTYKVVIGARSALWLPFSDLGVIIVDEEHDASYKQQDPAPRFQARDSAIVLAQLHNAKVLLASATPSIESLYNVQTKKYGFVALKTRYNNLPLPTIKIVAAKQIHAALSQHLTVPLLEKTNEVLQAGKQVIYFQNKRGYAPFLICGVCGWVPQCRNCDVSLTYHKYTDKLHCHYCGTKAPRISRCLQCGNNKIVSKNFGTEKIEEDLIRIYPNRAVARMDWDSTRSREKQEKILSNFEKGRIDILVGTQMVTKGLDFANVGLVAILNADSLLSYPDFRTQERAFQLMTQVSGRAGRSDGEGMVYLQTNNSQHPVFGWLQRNDYKAFYQQELFTRREFGYPPFVRMIKLVCKHRNEEKVKNAALDLVAALKELPEIEIKGPSSGIVPRIQNLYIEEIWIKISRQCKHLNRLKYAIANECNILQKKRGNSTIQININVDPY